MIHSDLCTLSLWTHNYKAYVNGSDKCLYVVFVYLIVVVDTFQNLCVYGSLRQLCNCFLVVLRGLVPDPTRNWNLIWHQIPDPNLFSHTRSSPGMFFFVIHWTKYWGDNFIKMLKLAWLESLRVVGNTLTMGRTLKHFQWQKPRYFHKFFFDRIHESWADTFLI